MSQLSVVAVPLAGGAALERLLERLLEPGVLPEGAQLVAVCDDRSLASDRIEWVSPGDAASIPNRRAKGLAASRGDIIAFIEDTTRPCDGWGQAITDLHEKYPRALAIGGTLGAGEALSPDQKALVALDYGRFLNRPSGVADSVPGNNMSFKRSALSTVGALDSDAFRETEVVQELIDGAHVTDGKVRLEEAMGAQCVTTDERSVQPINRFHHGRLYAGHRYEDGHYKERVLRAAAAPLLAATLVQRGLGALKRAQVETSASTVQSLVVMSSAWALGETLGYLTGPGDAERHWS